MNNSDNSHKTDPESATSVGGKAKPQREDQPLKELTEPAEDPEQSGKDDIKRQNAQGEHEGAPHDPSEFDPLNPQVNNDGKPKG